MSYVIILTLCIVVKAVRSHHGVMSQYIVTLKPAHNVAWTLKLRRNNVVLRSFVCLEVRSIFMSIYLFTFQFFHFSIGMVFLVPSTLTIIPNTKLYLSLPVPPNQPIIMIYSTIIAR